MRKFGSELVSEPGEMLNVLTESKTNGTTVGINAPVLGQEIVITAVDDIVIGESITVVLKNYDVTGYMLETNKLKLGDIRSVCPFTSSFENPFMKTLKHSKSL